ARAYTMQPTLKAFASRLAPFRNQFSEFATTPCRGCHLRPSALAPFEAPRETLPDIRRVSLRDRETAEKADAIRRRLASARRCPVPGQFLSPTARKSRSSLNRLFLAVSRSVQGCAQPSVQAPPRVPAPHQALVRWTQETQDTHETHDTQDTEETQET